MAKTTQYENLRLDKIVGGGQTMGTLADGRKAFIWGGLPGETVTVNLTKKKSHMVEGIVTGVINPSKQRISPQDPNSYLSTSPWQIMDFAAEQHYKSALIEEAFELHDIVLPDPIVIYSDGREFGYRNKLEFSWYGHEIDGVETLDLSFFARGSHGKIPVEGSSLAIEAINVCARAVRDTLRANGITARELKTLLVRADQQGNCAWQLYIKDENSAIMSETQMRAIDAKGGEIIYSDPKSPASRITKRLVSVGGALDDKILGTTFRYATEGFFQINLPVYEQALKDMQTWIPGQARNDDTGGTSQPERKRVMTSGTKRVTVGGAAPASEEISDFSEEGADRLAEPTFSDLRAATGGNDGSGELRVIDLYAGVGSIGLTIGGDAPELIEINEDAVREMKRNIKELHSNATAILAPSEKALDYITGDKLVVVDPPRAGLHKDVIDRLLETTPQRIIYLSCNPVTQARDVALLQQKYTVTHHMGYNFFPRTPHIEHLVVLDLTN